MLDIVLSILSILGIVLLVLLGVVLVILLLVLFFPVTYRINGQKSTEETSVQVKAQWLFGLLRVYFSYPETGRLIMKVLFFKVFDSGDGDKEGVGSKSSKGRAKKVPSHAKEESAGVNEKLSPDNRIEEDTKTDIAKADQPDIEPLKEVEESAEEPTVTGKESIHDKISAKYSKIKYTILKICDRIRHVWENISFYQKLLTEENTRELFKHACFRMGKILKSIRPRKLNADVLFGAASPDTTGYLYGAYCMLSPKFGKDIHVTPDFDQAILEGRLYVAGHITVIQFLIHGIGLLLDKRLKIFLRRLKKHEASKSKQ